VPPQICITRDNISVEVDGVLYMTVMEPQKASYGVGNYRTAAIQLSQTTMRSVIGKLELDRTFEERETINSEIINAVDKASAPWGVKVNRYEVKNITPPQSIKDAMEKRKRAERERRALIAEFEGDKTAWTAPVRSSSTAPTGRPARSMNCPQGPWSGWWSGLTLRVEPASGPPAPTGGLEL
jgi:regulator of protease activity HflC (stomatin/prohibitin superfamily)